MSFRRKEDPLYQINFDNSNKIDFTNGMDYTGKSSGEIINLFGEVLKNGIHGFCFSLYEDGQKPGDIISEEQVRRRMEIIAPYTKWVRSFSCTEGNEFIPIIAHEFGIKTLVGAWLGNDPEVNEREIEGLIKLAKEGFVDIAAVGNEPLGNDNNWESMHYSPAEMTNFVQNHLGPVLEANGKAGVKILGYDQNRAALKEWIDTMYKDEHTAKYFAGTAIHWYESTYEVFPEALQYAHQKAPNKYLVQTEACVDAEVPHWNDDAWYWSKEATDWGWDWASEKDKYLHPKYAPVNRYATDIIGCLNNRVDGWVDWNMVLDRQGGPNWCKNWCTAPVIVDTEKEEVYFTPLYFTMAHFSKFMRPGGVKIGCTINHKDILATAVKNPDGSIAVVVFNPTSDNQHVELKLNKKLTVISISSNALQTIIIKP